MLGLAFRFKMGLPALAIHPVRWVSKVQQTRRRKNGGLLHFVSTARNFGSGVRYGGLAAPTEATRYGRDCRTHSHPASSRFSATCVTFVQAAKGEEAVHDYDYEGQRPDLRCGGPPPSSP